MNQNVRIDMEPRNQKIQQNNGQTSQLYEIFGGEYDLIELFQIITVVLFTVVLFTILIVRKLEDFHAKN